MSVPLKQAVAEAGTWLPLLGQSEDPVDVTTLNHWGYPPLTLGTVRALYELAADFQAIFEEYTPEEVARALSR